MTDKAKANNETPDLGLTMTDKELSTLMVEINTRAEAQDITKLIKVMKKALEPQRRVFRIRSSRIEPLVLRNSRST